MDGEPGHGSDERPIDVTKYLKEANKRGDAVIPFTSLNRNDVIEVDLLKGDKPEKARLKITQPLTNFDFYEDTGKNPKLTVIDPGPLPEELRGAELRLEGSLIIGAVMAPNAIREGYPLELSQESGSERGRTIITPTVTSFSVKRPAESGELEEIPLNALTRRIESANFNDFQQLIQFATEQSAKANRTANGFEARGRKGLRSHDYVFSPYPIEGNNFLHNPEGPRDYIYIFSKDRNEVYVLHNKDKSSKSHLQVGVYPNITYRDILEMRSGVLGLSTASLNKRGAQRIVYNASSTSTALDGGIYFEPSKQDIGTLGYEPDDWVVHKPKIFILPTNDIDIKPPVSIKPESENKMRASDITRREIGADLDQNNVYVRMGQNNISFPRVPDLSHIRETLANAVAA